MGACGQLEWAQHFTMHADFGFCSRRMKKTQRESWKATYLKTVYIVCTNMDVCISKVYTHSNQKSWQECTKQLTYLLTFSTILTLHSYHSLPSQLVLGPHKWYSAKCPSFGEKAITSKSTVEFSADCHVWACITRNASPVLKNDFDRTCAICFWIEKCKFGLK